LRIVFTAIAYKSREESSIKHKEKEEDPIFKTDFIILLAEVEKKSIYITDVLVRLLLAKALKLYFVAKKKT